MTSYKEIISDDDYERIIKLKKKCDRIILGDDQITVADARILVDSVIDRFQTPSLYPFLCGITQRYCMLYPKHDQHFQMRLSRKMKELNKQTKRKTVGWYHEKYWSRHK